YTRWFILDENRTAEEEKAIIIALIRGGKPPTPSAPDGVFAESLTISHGISGTSRDILRYRHLFKECSSEEWKETHESFFKSGQHRSMESVSLMGQYFEDELGNEISEIEMHDQMAGGKTTIIFGKPESVTRLGPTIPKDREGWSVDTANTMAQFFQVVDLIRDSTWMAAPLTITQFDKGDIASSSFPSTEAALSILVLFRQLFSSNKQDDLFNRACGAYIRHCEGPIKAEWVKVEKSNFNGILNGRPWPGLIKVDCPTAELLDAFLYGARLIHSRDDKRQESTELLRGILDKTPREHLVMGVNAILS
ncbi:MAG: hypothetical protein IH987_21255, partial [Planctomycetes bacterium]|nr:hypothetical protein [Planctomycetota bacterium]